jgi:hypothetical protein
MKHLGFSSKLECMPICKMRMSKFYSGKLENSKRLHLEKLLILALFNSAQEAEEWMRQSNVKTSGFAWDIISTLVAARPVRSRAG